MNYHDFLASKRIEAQSAGFHVDRDALNPVLFDWQKDIVVWALARGRAALFEDCGLGKTPQQLEWAKHVHMHTGRNVLILAPLAVSQQTVREGRKFGIHVTPCRSQADVQAGINITNYEMLEHFDMSRFGGVVLDESSILKSYMGKTKQALVDVCARIPYRLACTATPAPNDHLELGNHSEFLGIMPSHEMIARWFINDTMNFGKYRLKGHAEASFWEWVASWAVSLRRPSDIGYSDAAYNLPPLHMHQVDVGVDLSQDAGEALFRMPAMNATGLHREMRLTAPERAAATAALVNGSVEHWVVWCNTNYEADELTALIPDAIEIRGSETLAEKERKLTLFTTGDARVVITKPSIAGFGLNWQHCHNAVFVGLSYSYEQLYQAVRRIYRFGQTQPVQVYLVVAETEGVVLKTLQDKMTAHDQMQVGMYAGRGKLALGKDLALVRDAGRTPMRVPAWIMETV